MTTSQPSQSLPPRPNLEQYRKQAKDLVKSFGTGGTGVIERIKQHHPRLRGISPENFRGHKFTLSDAQLVIAREYGFDSWPKFQGHIQAMSMNEEPPIHDQITEPLFKEAVRLLDAGKVLELETHLDQHPHLLASEANFSQTSFEHGTHQGQYFRQPRLLWFVAENPIRNRSFPDNIVEVTQSIIDRQRAHSKGSLQHDLNYTLELVVSGCVARETGYQQDLINVLVGNGADPNCPDVALCHRELDAVQGLLDRGARMTLAVAAGMGFVDDLRRLFDQSNHETRLKALASSTINGQAAASRFLIDRGVSPNQFNPDGFHSHCTPLHNAVNSGSSEVVSILLGAGADTTIKDKMYDSDALGWAKHMKRDKIARLIEEARGPDFSLRNRTRPS